jgi:drug/metabolite transporter (DMT)-like permease
VRQAKSGHNLCNHEDQPRTLGGIFVDCLFSVTPLSLVLLGERLTGVKVVALGLALLGTALTVGPAGGQVLGIVLAVSAALIYSVYILVGAQVLKEVSAVQSSTVIFAAAGVMAGVLLFFRGAHWPQSSAGCSAIAAIVLIATVLPVVGFLAGLERVGPTTAARLSTLEPVVTVLLATWLLGEQLQFWTGVGGGLSCWL